MLNKTTDQLPIKRQEKSLSPKNPIPKHDSVEGKLMEGKTERLLITGYRFFDAEVLKLNAMRSADCLEFSVVLIEKFEREKTYFKPECLYFVRMAN